MHDTQSDFIESKGLDTYSKSHVGENRGEKYDAKMFSGVSYSNNVWKIEQYILTKLVDKYHPATYLDFACGTGRVISYLEKKVQRSVGVDISPDMVAAARKKVAVSELLCLDILKEDASNLANTFDCITAFRFFLNAERQLKEDVMARLPLFMANTGKLIFNIHQNPACLDYCIEWCKRLLKGDKTFGGNWMSVADARSLAERHNLRVVTVYSYAVLPRVVTKLLPVSWWLAIEKKLVSKRFWWGSHFIVVCEKR